MIAHLSGTILRKDNMSIVLDVSGVGYKVFTTGNTIQALTGDTADLWIHNAIRETANDLYGFLSHEELLFFELLITISGIGPKTALGILNVATIETIRHAVLSENTSHLVKVSGIGKKNAEKIVLELRGKLGTEHSEFETGSDVGDAIEALTTLGYTQKEAREALKEVPKDIQTTSDRVKHALKFLSHS